MAIDYGTALSLGNLATPDRTQSLTNALLNKQRMDLAGQARKAKEADEARKIQQQIEGSIAGMDKAVSPYFYDEMKKALAEGMTNQFIAGKRGDQIGATVAKNEMLSRGTELVQKSKAFDDIIDARKQGYIVPDVAEKMRNLPKDKALELYKQEAEKNPVLPLILSVDESGNPSMNRFTKYENDEDLAKSVRDMSRSMSFVKKTADVDANTQESLYKLPKNVVSNLAETYARDPERMMNLQYNDPKTFEAELNNVKRAMPTLSPQGQMVEAGKRLFEQKIEKVNEEYRKETRPTGNGLNIDFTANGGGYNVSGNVFNSTLKEPSDNLDLYTKSGIISKEEKALYDKMPPAEQVKYLNRIPKLISISTPNKGRYEINDENGKPTIVDNVEFVYVPKGGSDGKKGGQWYITGFEKSDKKEVQKNIPINESTYGSIISIYPKMNQASLEKMLNKRMQDGGITNDVFSLSTSKGTTAKSGNKQPSTQPKYQAKVTVKGR